MSTVEEQRRNLDAEWIERMRERLQEYGQEMNNSNLSLDVRQANRQSYEETLEALNQLDNESPQEFQQRHEQEEEGAANRVRMYDRMLLNPRLSDEQRSQIQAMRVSAQQQARRAVDRRMGRTRSAVVDNTDLDTMTGGSNIRKRSKKKTRKFNKKHKKSKSKKSKRKSKKKSKRKSKGKKK